MRVLIWGCLLVLGLGACSSETDRENEERLQGKWAGKEWLVFDQDAGRNADAVSFEFTSDGRYKAVYGDQAESGVYRMKGDKLYTTADQKIEKMVKVLQLQADTLVFGMNRMGQEEKLLLVRSSE